VKLNKPSIFMLRVLLILIGALCLVNCKQQETNRSNNDLRAPAYPLITIDSYSNAWLFGDTLYKQQICHNTGREFPLVGVIRVDGKSYRFMGADQSVEFLAVASSQGVWKGKYIFNKPEGNWTQIKYNDDAWMTGEGAFGYSNRYMPEVIIRTPWKSEHIWIRREFVLEEDLTGKNVFLEYSNDDDAEIYINGIEVVNTGHVLKMGEKIQLSDDIVASLRKGKNIIAAHCINRIRNSIIDFGLTFNQPISPVIEHTAIQKSVNVQPTQTIYSFTCGGVDLKLTFTAPLLMDDLELLSRPLNYISYEVASNDSKTHEVELYFEIGTEWVTSYDCQESVGETFEKGNLAIAKMGSVKQDILSENGSDYIDWGYLYLAAKKNDVNLTFGDYSEMRASFCSDGAVNKKVGRANNRKNRMSLNHSLGKVRYPTHDFIMLGYDDLYSVQYFGENLRPYWNRSGKQDIVVMLNLAASQYEKIKRLCDKFDIDMMHYANYCGGKEYAELCALAYRQTLSAHKLLMSPNDELLYLSNSVMKTATVDVTYPSAPLFLLYNIDLLKGMLNPIFYYVESGKWPYLFAPHDIGDYPHANGEASDNFRLPVEESGNMLILTAAIATMEGDASYAENHWNTLTQWADYLLNEGFRPENQLNTDVFTGLSANNSNLSIKAILGIASFARLADMLGKNGTAKKYAAEARLLAQEWTTLADDGDYYRFAFDQPNTWSQKYNLVWDKIMKMDVFPHEIREKEVAYYLTKQNKYGLPLDSRNSYTKADWIVWTATLSPNKETFQQFISPLYRFVNETSARVPMADWYWTETSDILGFQGRPVVGGYFIKMMEDKLINK